MMPERLNSAQLIELTESIAMRQVLHEERGRKMLELATFAKFSIVWRTTLHSNTSARAVWNVLESRLIDMEVIMAMTNEFVFRVGGLSELPYQELAESLSWSQGAFALPEEISQFSSTVEDYKTTLKANPWLCFLYLVSMSEVCNRLDAVLPKQRKPLKEEPK